MQQYAQLTQKIAQCMVSDRHRLSNRLNKLRTKPAPDLDSLQLEIDASIEKAVQRHNRLPPLTYPALPVSEKRDDIIEAIRNNQVVIICGETGSGKTTQLPKLCLEAGRGIYGLIGHTQPRRIAARSVAARIAEELKCEMGTHVGYKIRFSDHTRPDSYIKLMTDGILLAELQKDRFLNQYDTLIIDEAHERSLNIDFLLGYLKILIKKRPELKIIITSATIDPQRFAKHFNDAPVIEVSGRTYPVEVRYRPLLDIDEQTDRDQISAILDATDELGREGPGDILVFLSGEREIRETAEALRKHHPPHTEILPLYARLGAAEQNRIFAAHGQRRIVLATNVAETSLTVPGIRYVIDTGYARISRYSFRSKVQRLPIEKISQASANQRKGRCGRVAEGICIRLYSEDDFNHRAEFTDAEILRTNLASVILQMESLRLGHVEDFPFVDMPDKRLLKDGYRLLDELQATRQRSVTALGRKLARLPVDPRLGHMLLAASDYHALDEVLIIASALSIQDPRERPVEKQQKADEAHSLYQDEDSDFLAYVNLWRFYQDKRHHLSRNKLRKLCQQRFLSYRRMEEWRDIHSQLLTHCKEMKLAVNSEPASYANIHMALLSGLLSQVGMKTDEGDYEGVRNSRFHIFPGSGLFKKKPKWLMCGALIETSRLYAHHVAKIQVEWIESLASHLLKYHYDQPHWSKKTAQVSAWRKATLYGLVINPKQRVNYGPIDPEASRAVFIRHALVLGEYQSHAPFFAHNLSLIEDVEQLEHKSRRLDVMVDEQVLFEFYDQRIPKGIYNGHAFEKWRKQAEKTDPQLLFLSRDAVMQHEAEHVTEAQYPDQLMINGIELALHYHFEPGHELDGVTVDVPLPLLSHLDSSQFEWLVPGLLEDKITALIRALPKSLRKHFVPAPDFARKAIQKLEVGRGELITALSQQLASLANSGLSSAQLATELASVELDTHFKMNFRLLDEQQHQLAMSRDLPALQDKYQQKVQRQFSDRARWEIEKDGISGWDFGDLPEVVSSSMNGLEISGYPALVDQGDSVAIRVY
ncbi:MAG: ATP-dependent RNA helicase HrpA, partial [Thioalkalispiraceae bacterium]